MERFKDGLRWLEPAIIIAVILYVMDIQIDGIKKEITLFREDVNRSLSRHETEIKATDQKIDNLKNAIISKK